MHIVIPIIIRSEFDFQLLRSHTANHAGNGFKIIQNLVESGASVHVVAETDEVLQILSSLKIDVHCTSIIAEQNNTLVPDGTQMALRYLVERNILSEQDTVALFDFRTPELNAQHICTAFEIAMENPEAIVASMCPVRDYPTQFSVPYQVMALETFVFPDSNAPCNLPGNHTLSCPFFLDWRAYGVWDTNFRYYSLCLNTHIFIPVTEEEVIQSRPDMLIFSYVNPVTACRVLHKQTMPHVQQGVAVPTLSLLNDFPITVSRNASGRITLTHAKQIKDSTQLVRVWPFGHGKTIPEGAVETELNTDIHLDVEADGVIIALLSSNIPQDFDFSEPVTSDDTLWTIDPLSQKRMDPQTGKPILQRQHVPPFHQADKKLAVGRVTSIINMTLETTYVLPLFLSDVRCTAPFNSFTAQCSK